MSERKSPPPIPTTFEEVQTRISKVYKETHHMVSRLESLVGDLSDDIDSLKEQTRNRLEHLEGSIKWLEQKESDRSLREGPHYD